MECAKFDVCPANVSYNIDKKNIWPTDQTTYFVTVYFLSDETAWDELVLRQTMITMQNCKLYSKAGLWHIISDKDIVANLTKDSQRQLRSLGYNLT